MTKLFILILLTISLVSCTSVPEAEYLDGTYIPYDLDDCFRELDKEWSEENKRLFAADDYSPYRAHFGAGMGMRNSWGLWKGSRLKDYFIELGISHPDHMSGLILKGYRAHLRDEPLEIERMMKSYITIEKALRGDALTNEEDEIVRKFFEPVGAGQPDNPPVKL